MRPINYLYMLLIDKLKDKKIILASGSPRRRELMSGLGIDYTVDTETRFDEFYPDGLEIRRIPEYLACGKSRAYPRPLGKDDILITADTLVYCQERILGKPKSREEAVEMLRLLQNNKHTVLTGVCIRSLDKEISFTSSSDVYFNKISDEEIDYYIDHYKPFDKAGSYGVQEWIGYIGLLKIEGSFYNIMGLPVQRLYTELEKFVTR